MNAAYADFQTGWPTFPLGKLCEINIGRTPSRDRPDYWGFGYPWLSIADMNQGRDLETTKESITDVAVRECNCRLVPIGTVLLSFKLSIGKVGITRIPLFTNEAIASLRIRDSNKLSSDYLYWALQSIDLKCGLDRAAKGLTLNKAKLVDIKIPLPPLDKQRRIADILDRAEALRAKRRAALAQLDELTQSVYLDMFGDAVSNPREWQRYHLKQCINHVQIGPFGSLLHKEDYVSDGIPLINPMHIVDGKIIPDMNQSVTVQKHAELQLYQLRKGDVIMGRRGEMGRCAIVEPEYNGILCGTGSLFIRPDESKATATYLQATLSNASMRKHLEGLSLGVTLQNLNRGIVEELAISLPPIELQREFAHRIAAIEKLKALHKTSLVELDDLFSSLQYRAFRGEL